MRTLELREGHVSELPPDALGDAEALALIASRWVAVEFPSPANARHFVLRPTSTVGLMPISGDLMIRVIPKVPVPNLFGMLEVVHELPSFEFYEGIGEVAAIEDVYAKVARLFARQVTRRVRLGLCARYLPQSDECLAQRGRIDVAESMRLRQRGSLALYCRYEVHTVDNEDNQILLAALDRIPRLALPILGVLSEIHAARRALLGSVSLRDVPTAVLRNRRYDRLNADYALLHALARFFLERMGPGVEAGDHAFLPFTVDMAVLFQEYVVNILQRHAPPTFLVTRQYAAMPSGDFQVRFSMDAVVRDSTTGAVLAIVDAKYKTDSKPSSDDIEQVVAYATQTGATRAFLVYPFSSSPGRIEVGPTRSLHVARLGFALDQPLEEGAREFAKHIFNSVADFPSSERERSRA